MSKFGMLSPKNRAIALIDCQPTVCPEGQSHERLVVFTTSTSLPGR